MNVMNGCNEVSDRTAAICQSVDADHKNNARNEFLRSDVYEKMVLRMNLALLLKKL